MTPMKPQTPVQRTRQRLLSKAEREELEQLRFNAQRAKDMEARYSAYVGKLDTAIEQLMRDVLAEVIGRFSHPNSIASGRLIAAIAKASATIHADDSL